MFPTPIVLDALPTLIGYYRLLLGRPQKSFYSASKDWYGIFKSMEETGRITERQLPLLPALCQALSVALGELVVQISPPISTEDVHQLPILTLGSQLQGANNNVIGREGTKDVFSSIASIIDVPGFTRTANEIVFTNSAGRRVFVTLASDPDVRVREESSRADQPLLHKLAIEIKGGTDASNAHNRAGEAERATSKHAEKTIPSAGR